VRSADEENVAPGKQFSCKEVNRSLVVAASKQSKIETLALYIQNFGGCSILETWRQFILFHFFTAVAGSWPSPPTHI
jgi:hypothetical protein